MHDYYYYITHDSDTTFKVKRSKVNLQGAGHIVAASRTACWFWEQEVKGRGRRAGKWAVSSGVGSAASASARSSRRTAVGSVMM